MLGKQIAFTFFTNVVILICSPIKVFLLTRSLSIEDYGELSLLIVTVNLFSYLLTFGLDQFIIGQLPLRKDKEEQNYLKSIFLFSSIASFVLIGMFLVYSLQKHNVYSDNFLLLSLLTIVSLYSFLTIQYLYSRGQLYRYNVLILLKNVPWILLLGVFYFWNNLTTEKTLYLWLICLSAVAVLGSVQLKDREIFKASLDVKKIGEALRYSIPLFPFLVGPLLMISFDRYIIAHYFSTTEVALYVVAYMIIEAVSAAITAISTTIFPHFVKAWGKDEYENTHNDPLVLQNVSLTLSLVFFFPCAVVLLFVGKEIILLIAGPAYLAAARVIQMLSILPLFKIFLMVLQQELMVRSKTLVICKAYVIGIICNLILNFILVPKFGLYGAAMANISAYILIFILISIGLSKLRSIKDIYRLVKVREIFSYAAVGIGVIFVFKTFLNLIFATIIGVSIYFLLLIKNRIFKVVQQFQFMRG